MVKMDETCKDSSKLHSQQCLFPIASGIKDSEQKGFLFPCVSSQTDTKEQKAHLDWLVNQSYQTKHDTDCKRGKFTIQPLDADDEVAAREVTDGGSSSGEEKKKPKKSRRRKRSDSESSGDKGGKYHKKRDKRKKHRKQEKTKKQSYKDEPTKPDTIWIEESGLAPEKAYRIYCKPDVENLYGSLYRLDVATYKIKSNLLCLGVKKNYSLFLNEKKKKKAGLKDKESRYWRDTTALLEPPMPILPSKSSLPIFVGNVDNFAYIPIDLPSSRETREEREDQRDGNENTDLNIDPVDRIISQQTAELNNILRDNPTDIKTWIELADFQVKAVQREDSQRESNTAEGNKRKKKHSKIVTEKQISVLEKALEQNPTSIELIMYHLELCTDWWDDDKLAERWKNVVFAHPNKTILWRKYLFFLQSRVSMFTFRKTQKAYEKCFTLLSSIKEGTFVSHCAEPCIEEDLLDLFVMKCKFMKQSGHIEKSLASFQAMVELNCLCPDEFNANTPLAGQIAFLETFWDSGQPRFGETGALGWKTWMDKTTQNKKPLGLENLDLKKIFKLCQSSNTSHEGENTPGDQEEELVKWLPKWKAWLKVEVCRGESQLQSWQPDPLKGETEDSCEDPERVILFDDISSSLFKLHDLENKFRLVLCFLEVLGVPLHPLASSQSSDISKYFETSVESVEQIVYHNDCVDCGVGWQRHDYWYHSEDDPLKTSLPSFERLQLVRNIFAESLPLFEGESQNYLITTWLRYEFYLSQLEKPGKTRRQRNKEVYKLAKAILKEPSNRNNFAVWEVFAKMKAAAGDIPEARRVLDSTLLLATQLELDDAKKKITLAPLFRSYIEMEFRQTSEEQGSGSHNRILHLLASFTENTHYEPLTESTESKAVSSARILKAKRAYSQLCDNAIQGLKSCSEDSKRALLHIHCVVCSALFSYVTTGIEACIAVYERVLSSLSTADDAFNQERLWTSYLHVLKMHSQQDNLPLKSTKKALHRAVKAFPNNSFFLDYFLQMELKSNLTGEVRRFFDHLTHSATSPIPWIFAIHYETMRSKAMLSAIDCNDYRLPSRDGQSVTLITSLPTTGISHRQRALFDRATSSVAGRQCVALWRMYIAFELRQGHKEQARAVYYQALQNCAWAKTLYLDAVKAFPDDLQNICDMMEEKELRLRTPLEEIDILMGQ